MQATSKQFYRPPPSPKQCTSPCAPEQKATVDSDRGPQPGDNAWSCGDDRTCLAGEYHTNDAFSLDTNSQGMYFESRTARADELVKILAAVQSAKVQVEFVAMAMLTDLYDRIRNLRQAKIALPSTNRHNPQEHTIQKRTQRVPQDATLQTDLAGRNTNSPNEKSLRTSTLMKYDAVIPCGICRKSFDAALPRALFAHVAAHFDRRYSYNRCEGCQMNFVSFQDLRAHLKSVTLNKTCGYMFNHTHPCGGHHPPRKRTVRGQNRRPAQAATDKDSDRFDFCYRLRGWEDAQLASHRNATPTTASSPKAAHHMQWALQHTGLLRMSFLNSSRTSHSTCGTPISENTASQGIDNGVDCATASLGAALLRAICTGSVELVGAFVYAGADINFRDIYGFGPMHYAARYGSPGIIRLLIRNGVSVDDHDQKGESPLMHAIQAGMCDLAECFLYLGAVLHEAHLVTAISTGERSVIKMLLRYWVQSDSTDKILDRFLLTAIQQRDRHMVDVLLQSGANGSAEDDTGNTALALAVETGDKEIAQLLLDHGAQPDCSPGMQYNLIVDALKYRHLAMVELLLSKETA